MPKRKAGLPTSFDLQVEPSAVADMGDYLDEVDSVKTVGVRSQRDVVEREERGQVSPEAAPRKGDRAVATEPESRSHPPTRRSDPKSQSPRSKRRGARPPRSEIGFDPETLEQLQKLWADAIAKGGEPNLSRSDIARGCIRAAFEAKREIDFTGIRPRGAWRSQTARALQDTITTAVMKGIGRIYQARYAADDDRR